MPFKRQMARSVERSVDTKSIFIARATELLFFIQHILEPEEPTHNIISISGQGGVGKSTLINRFIEEARAENFKDYCLTARVDERQATPAGMMEHFAHQLRNAGQTLKKFEEVLASYKESLRRLHAEPKEEPEILVRETVDAIGTIVEEIPFAGGLVHKGANTATELLIDKAQRRRHLRDAAKLEDALADLTKAFVKDLNQIAETQVTIGSHRTKRYRRIILFFDTFEQLASDAVPWLLDYFLEADINPNILLVVAGRDSIERSASDDPKRWLPYLDNKDISLIMLNSFNEQETSTYLLERGITDATKVSQFWQKSHGLPLYLGLLTSNPGGDVDPTADVVENFLRWIPKHEQLKHRLALDASLFSLPFNQDDLEAFAYLEHSAAELYQWLIAQPFVRSNAEDGRHSYHDLAQEMFSRYLYQRSSREWCATHQMIATYYRQCIERLQIEGGKEVYKTAEWLDLALAIAQQMFFLPDEASRKEMIEQILTAYEHRYGDELEKIARVLRKLSQEQNEYPIQARVRRILELLLQCVEHDLGNREQEFLAAVNSLLEMVSYTPLFSTKALAYLYRYRGRTYRDLEQYDHALTDYDKALALVPDYTNAYAGRGETYRLIENYQLAIADFDRAIDLDPDDDWSYASRGQTYSALKDFDHAIQDYTHALEIDHQYTWVYYSRGLTYYTLKDYDHAIRDYTHILEIDSQYKWAYDNRGDAYRKLEDYERAILDYTRALDIDPQYIPAYNSRGLAYSALKNFDHAIHDYTQTLEIDPQYKWAYYNRGNAYRELKDFEHAILDYTCALDIDPQYKWAYDNRGDAYRSLKDYDHAIQDYTHALDIDPQYKWAYDNRGDAYYELQNYERAILDYTHALEIDPQYTAAYYDRGRAYFALKDYDHAIPDYTRALDIDPQYKWAYDNRGDAYYALQDYEHAILDYTHAIDIDPQYAWTYNNRGNAYCNLKDYEHAIQDYTHALDIDPQHKWAYYNRGNAYRDLKDFEHAILDYTHALDIDPQHKWAYDNRGDAYFALQDYEHAIQDYTHALDIDPQHEWAYHDRGRAYSALKDYDLAIQDYTHALDIDPQHVWAYYDRGNAYSALQDYEHAILDYTSALDIDPQHVWIYYNRGIAYLWQKDLTRAKTEFIQSWQADSTVANYGWMIAFVEMCQQKPDLTMVKDLEAYAQADLKSAEAQICLGVVQWLQGNFKLAQEQLECTIRIDPDSQDTFFWQGVVHASLQNDSEAITAIEKSLELDLPPILLSPLRWFAQTRPDFYEQYVKPLMARWDV